MRMDSLQQRNRKRSRIAIKIVSLKMKKRAQRVGGINENESIKRLQDNNVKCAKCEAYAVRTNILNLNYLRLNRRTQKRFHHPLSKFEKNIKLFDRHCSKILNNLCTVPCTKRNTITSKNNCLHTEQIKSIIMIMEYHEHRTTQMTIA